MDKYESNLTGAYLDEQNTLMRITPEGGIAVRMINNTGANSVKGTLLEASSVVDNAVVIQTNEVDTIGIMYSDGVANGEEVWVVVSGKAQVLIKDGITAVRDYWVFTSTTDGRADMLVASSGGTIQALEGHFNEIGHCVEAKASGTNVLALVVIHFN